MAEHLSGVRTPVSATLQESLLEFTVPGNPRPKERPRFNGHAYTAKDTAGAELVVGWEARKAMAKRPRLEVPLWVEIDFRMDTRRRVDLDNLAKLVLDACNEVVWADDSQIERLVLTRAVDRDRPRTEVRVFARGEIEAVRRG